MKYKLFGRTGLRVAEVCLGTMTFGEDWGVGANSDESKRIFEAYTKAGGNFLDTANRYTEGSSEQILSDLIAKDRDYFVLASKYSLYDRRDDVNASGNHRKNLMRSVEASLKRLKTDYLDILWVHAWDFTTSVEEVLRGLDDLVRQGKVHYLGISDTPAWIVSQANAIAELRGWTAFAGLQIEYSLVQRTPERDLIPMAKYFGMTVTPWAPLGAGILTGKYNQGMIAGGRLSEKSLKYNEKNLSIAHVVVDVAQNLGITPSQVALAWIKARESSFVPIIGARREEQIIDSLKYLDITLPKDDFLRLEDVSAIDLGFPHDFLLSDGVKDVVFGGNYSKIEHRKK
jgi:aryl-alcohol dehydrogenase-like predicted oxidoreductase